MIMVQRSLLFQFQETAMHYEIPSAAVALVVKCSKTNRYYFLKELKTKRPTRKKKGMLSIPIEGMKPGETVPEAFERLRHEELGIELLGEIRYGPEVDGFIHQIPVHLAWVEVDKEFVAHPTDSDVAHGGWLSTNKIRALAAVSGKLRIEVPRLFEVYQAQSQPV